MKRGDLTIILTLKGRHLHTLRWLWHANRTHLPFHVIVADGEVDPTVDRLLADSNTFPNLSYEYHRYADRSVKDYYAKRRDALEKVDTPYVMMSDNDDFLLPYGINKSIAFLDREPEYVCAGGGIPGFRVGASMQGIPDVQGPLLSIDYRYISNLWYWCRDIDSPSASVRVLEEIQSPLAVHYNVYRTAALRAIAAEVQSNSPSLIFCEMYSAMRTMTLGKVKSDPSCFTYMRQQGTSQFLGYSRDLVDDLLGSSLAADFKVMSPTVACEAAKTDGCDADELNERIYEAYADQLRLTLASTMLRYRFPRLFAFKRWLRELPAPRLLPTAAQRRLDLARIWRRLAADGADPDTMTAHAAEFDAVWSTLQGDDFFNYISDKAADLLAMP